MSLSRRIAEDLRAALKAQHRQRLAVLRLLKAAIDRERIDSGREPDDAGVVAVLRRAHRQRQEAAKMLADGGAQADSERELAEAAIIDEYLPQMMGEDEIAGHVDAAIEQAGAAGPADMGKVMGLLKQQLAGRADMKQVSETVRSRLSR